MKRLAWLLLAVFCTAMVQVRPADEIAPKAMTCPCCQPGPGAMPGCCPAPASTPAGFSLALSASAATRLPALRRMEEKFYASFFEPAAVRAALSASAEAAPAACVPLFRAHCSLLI